MTNEQPIHFDAAPRFSGSRWWKLDFHAHSPGSFDFNKGLKDAVAPTPREWLLAFMRAKVDCVAITDHNSAKWIAKLQDELKVLDAEKPADYWPTVLFPGAEINVSNGIHLLAILDPSTKASEVDQLLGAVGVNSESAPTTKSLVEVVEEIYKRGGIAIPAHVDESSGLFKDEKGLTLGQALESPHIIAYESVSPNCALPGLFKDKKVKWTNVAGSDAHHLDGATGPKSPGSHYTWIKMAKPSIEGVRLALLDGTLSTRRSDSITGDPNNHAELVIRDLHVHQAKYMGRDKALHLAFSPWLTAIIGGRGTGKSSLVEFLRLALGRQTHLPADLARDFENYFASAKSRSEPGLLTDQCQIVLHYEKDRVLFRLSWSLATKATTMEEQQADGTWKPLEGDLTQRFPVRIYSQKQIFHLAKKPRALLEVIDESTEVNRRGWQTEFAEQESAFKAIRAKVREAELRLAEEKTLRGELEDVERRIKALAESGYAETLKDYEKRARQAEAVRTFTLHSDEALLKLQALAKSIEVLQLNRTSFEEANDEAAVVAAAGAVEAAHAALQTKIASATGDFAVAVASWKSTSAASNWQKSVSAANDAYQTIVKSLKDLDGVDPRDFDVLIARRAQIHERLASAALQKDALVQLRGQEVTLLKDLEGRRQDLTKLREKFLADVLTGNNYVRIGVVPFGDAEHVVGELRRLLRRDSGYDKDFGAPAEDGILGSLFVDASKGTTIPLIQTMRSGIAANARGEQTAYDLGKKFVTHLKTLSPEDLDALDVWYPEDGLTVEYSPSGDGKNFQPIEAGSPGQMTAALLAFLLSYSRQPLILDQPEDDLDNMMIYSLIVSQVRDRKGRRQVILVTHNPNLVVNTDAEQVIGLKTSSGNTRIATSGGLQQLDVRDMVCQVMEGGRDAFEQRYRRIVLEAKT